MKKWNQIFPILFFSALLNLYFKPKFIIFVNSSSRDRNIGHIHSKKPSNSLFLQDSSNNSLNDNIVNSNHVRINDFNNPLRQPNSSIFSNKAFNDKLGDGNVGCNITAKAIFLCGGFGKRLNYDFGELGSDYYIPEGMPRAKQFIHIYNVPLFVYSLSEFIHNPNISEILIVTRPPWFRKVLEMILKSKEFISKYSVIEHNLHDEPEHTVDSVPDDTVNLSEKSLKRGFIFAYDLKNNQFVLDLKLIEPNYGTDDTNYDSLHNRYKFIKFCESGPERFSSAYNGLRNLEDYTADDEIVIIHDGARPLARLVDLKELISSASKFGGAVPGYQSTDTVKLAQNHKVLRTLDRNKTFIIQTPQAFKYKVIKDAYDNVLESDSFKYEPHLFNHFTDDASFVESQLRNHIVIIEGNRNNLKLNYNSDLDLFKFYLHHIFFLKDLK
ncbi:2-C-methyl-D-erythritol 4-phosphate cytidylyltransferase, putative [Theileria annulata]|uniref:2-C-methyl-D-erythritol 4-phosphate cytidylyltransferase, putative n=1 Tax=Theileria annulata TaxID=5874 RepID=Q4UD04_THEAN|nr:2-C-methyl-D-erythritol 4-phosphate cytidylyltransferase, putative [Theileria annulata]CAI75297.1 2-C-methyl-D-erythritol 4-phosphate cytidylyltransferase, putative [Theileria annulata]|eukprot:XP_954773.1 2-C-methyl-D-erythritol 4-phosphate cytidylyltransferase, putative [Theileria annulata]